MDQKLLAYAFETVLKGYKDRVDIDDNGIVSFWPTRAVRQTDEQRMRDAVVRQAGHQTEEEILATVSQYHSPAVMRARASAFRSKFSSTDWIVDLGGGTGWHWRNTTGAPILLVDFSLEMLHTARTLLSPADRVLLLHADASQLPIAPLSVSGFWSVQVFQHFPDPQLEAVLSELKSVLDVHWYGEVYNLNPAFLHRLICWIAGRPFHRTGKHGDLFVNRLTAAEWKSYFRQLCRGSGSDWEITGGYSELFFHPNFLPIMRRYPLWLENLLTKNAPRFAALFARQVQLIIKQS